MQIGMKYDDIKRDTAVIHVETFNSEKKRAGVAVKVRSGHYVPALFARMFRELLIWNC
jgi:hypothetical protein